ncbi:hypothetical protein J0X14_10390 [Muricauda sp. CAU 1633]|uniref:hypothetical protein n=1 Tax=Allomuricauda sp. CAU 1633 TaxID=2816036 RepID=UPI001A902D42|nr:hypothetical protein [Muricauda sp. CAU 1633]MBO0322705.1 hypothetical protein [Muricauda sp. CAU 1633]
MDKLEKHIKEKLEERTIAPSEGAWDKIASQVKEKSPKKRNSWFPYAIAASIAGIVLISVFFFTKDDPEVKQAQVVDAETKIETNIQEEKTAVDELLQREDSEVAEKESNISERKEELDLKQSIYSSAVAKQETKQPLQDGIELNSDKLIAQKVEEVVAQVALMESTKQDVSDAEVDSLLRAAQRQILADRLFSNEKSVDAGALLAQVEDELDESFRDQIFDALKSGYFKLRTAVADRNK